jgi:hypothetical protein
MLFYLTTKGKIVVRLCQKAQVHRDVHFAQILKLTEPIPIPPSVRLHRAARMLFKLTVRSVGRSI